jgi:hypothetical protein
MGAIFISELVVLRSQIPDRWRKRIVNIGLLISRNGGASTFTLRHF